VSYLSASVLVIHYKEALYQVYASLPLLYTADCECSKVRWYLRLSCREEAAVDGSDGGWFTSSALLSVMRSG